MNRFLIIILFLLLTSTSSFSEGHDEAVTVSNDTVKIAIVDFQRVLTESKIGKDYIKNAKKNIEKKQAALAKLEDKVRAMRDKFNEQKLVLDEKVRDQKAEELAYKIKELQRKTEDFQAEVKIADGKFQRDILSVLMKEVKSVAEQLGYDLVLSKASPGLMYVSTSMDITSKVLDRMNR
ncbi:OmpH family outer membrane protein [bacterium]|nr:OmpH family outer membrane protein [bacterium]|tara:strand:- start:730 stop:1266 length:537 start_codon:yes stop_codon:yes gene_type:complete